MRTSMIALAAAMALGTATISTAAMAQHHGGGGFGGGGGGGGGVHMGGGGGGGFGGGARMGGGGGFGGGAAMTHGGSGFAGGGAGFARHVGPGNGGIRGNFAGAPGNVAGARGNFAARGFDRDHDRHHGFRGFGFGGLYAFSAPGFYGYDNYYDDSCWQRQLVPTPYGLQWQLVDVCE